MKARTVVVFLAVAGAASWLAASSGAHASAPDPTADSNPGFTMEKLTPVLFVEEIEPVLGFWEGLGFERTMEVPDGDRLGFAAFQSGAVEIMYQTRASVANDLPQLADTPLGGTFLFIQVEDLDGVEAALEGADFVRPRRTTFYGMDEVVVREPGGNVVIFAMPTGGDD